jgi:hypothetical protein
MRFTKPESDLRCYLAETVVSFRTSYGNTRTEVVLFRIDGLAGRDSYQVSICKPMTAHWEACDQGIPFRTKKDAETWAKQYRAAIVAQETLSPRVDRL